MSIYEKVFNFLLTVFGVIYILESIAIYIGFFMPSGFNIGTAYLIIGVILLFGKYSKPVKDK